MVRLLFVVVAVVGFAAGSSTHRALLAQQQAACVDHSNDPAGCQPSTFDTPMALIPSVRVNRQGQVDPMSFEADAKAGAFELEKRLHLFRNFEHLPRDAAEVRGVIDAALPVVPRDCGDGQSGCVRTTLPLATLLAKEDGADSTCPPQGPHWI